MKLYTLQIVLGWEVGFHLFDGKVISLLLNRDLPEIQDWLTVTVGSVDFENPYLIPEEIQQLVTELSETIVTKRTELQKNI